MEDDVENLVDVLALLRSEPLQAMLAGSWTLRQQLDFAGCMRRCFVAALTQAHSGRVFAELLQYVDDTELLEANGSVW